MSAAYNPAIQTQVADPNRTLSTISPATGDVVVTREYPSSDQLDQAVQHAHAAHRDWRKVPLDERIRVVSLAVDHLASRALELGPELSAQMGRPKRYTAAEFATFKDRASWLLAQAHTALADQNVDDGRPQGFTRLIRRAPLGVCLLVGAWNVRRRPSVCELRSFIDLLPLAVPLCVATQRSPRSSTLTLLYNRHDHRQRPHPRARRGQRRPPQAFAADSARRRAHPGEL